MGLIPKNRDHGWVPYVWLVFLAFFILNPALAPHTSRREWLITIAATGIFLVLYFRVFWTGRPWNYALIVAMIAMGFGLGHMNEGASVFVILGSSFIAWAIQNSRKAFFALGALLLALAVDAVLFHAPTGFWASSMVVSLGV